MIALPGIVFALAFAMVQFSAIAYSPRLVAWLTRDPLPFHALGIFTATFLYSVATLAWIDRWGDGTVPLPSIMLVFALLVLSALMFARLVWWVNDVQLTQVLHFIGQQGRSVIRAMFPRLDAEKGTYPASWKAAVTALAQVPVTQALRYSGEPESVAQYRLARRRPEPPPIAAGVPLSEEQPPHGGPRTP